MAPSLIENEVFRLFKDQRLTQYDLEIAEKELNETPWNRTEALNRLKAMLAEEKGLNPRTDESFLLRYLRARKFDCQGAFKMMRSFYKLRANHPQFFRPPSELQETLKKEILVVSDYRNSEGQTLYIYRPGLWNPEKTTYEDFIAALNLATEFLLDDPVTQINGIVGIWDSRGISFSQMMHYCSPRSLAYTKAHMQDSYAARIKMVVAINCGSLAIKFWKCFKPFLKKKLTKRVHLLGSDLSELHRLVDPRILPADYGGLLPSYDYGKTSKQILNSEEHFRRNLQFGYIE